ncbi:hypothetical protein J6590_092102 [Homalodisca vitripennis]|nr:hypothetical protein J6590_092102 [Homalodisca vitripennis]
MADWSQTLLEEYYTFEGLISYRDTTHTFEALCVPSLTSDLIVGIDSIESLGLLTYDFPPQTRHERNIFLKKSDVWDVSGLNQLSEDEQEVLEKFLRKELPKLDDESSETLYPDIRCEALFVTVKTNSHTRMLIYGVCLPPNSTSEAYSYFAQTLEEVIASNPPFNCILFVGDFDLPKLNWVSPDSSLAYASEIALLDGAALIDVDQIRGVLNEREVQLYLAFGFISSCLYRFRSTSAQ